MVILTNGFIITKLVIILMMLFFLFACCWTLLGALPNGWRERENVSDDMFFHITVTSWYFVCTTATTIGYGDYYGMIWEEKIFIMILMFSGICIFSTITGSVRGLKFNTTIKGASAERMLKITLFMRDLD